MKFLHQPFLLGQYIPGHTIIHRLDPRVKILLVFVYMIAVFLVADFWSLLAFAWLGFLAVYLGGIGLYQIYRLIRPLYFLFIITIIIHLFFTEGSVIFSYGPIMISWEGLWNGLFFSIRLILLVISSSLIAATSSPVALTDSLENILSPLKIFRFPAHEFALMMTIALRFIPTMIREADRLVKAQIARGADFKKGGLKMRAKNLLPLLIPLFVLAFKRADELALAMEVRCYRGGRGRTKMNPLRIERIDLLAAFIGIFLMIFIVLIGRGLLII